MESQSGQLGSVKSQTILPSGCEANKAGLDAQTPCTDLIIYDPHKSNHRNIEENLICVLDIKNTSGNLGTSIGNLQQEMSSQNVNQFGLGQPNDVQTMAISCPKPEDSMKVEMLYPVTHFGRATKGIKRFDTDVMHCPCNCGYRRITSQAPYPGEHLQGFRLKYYSEDQKVGYFGSEMDETVELYEDRDRLLCGSKGSYGVQNE